MKKFRFEGNPNIYDWKIKPIIGNVYTVKEMNSMRHHHGSWVGITEKDVLKWKDFVLVDMNNFEEKIKEVLSDIENLLISKNAKYGNSALEPLGVFSKLSPKEGLLVRIDDKLKRIKNGSLDKDDEDVVNDLIGYLVLLKIHANREQSFDEIDGSHKWEKIKQREELISIIRADEKDGLYWSDNVD